MATIGNSCFGLVVSKKIFLLWNRLAKWTETWQEASMEGPLQRLLISSRFVYKHGRHRQFLFLNGRFLKKKKNPLWNACSSKQNERCTTAQPTEPFIIMLYSSHNKNWKIYWSKQSFTGLQPEGRCSSWGLFQTKVQDQKLNLKLFLV